MLLSCQISSHGVGPPVLVCHYGRPMD